MEHESTPIPSLLEGLNEPQHQAVTHTEGPLLVLAGAGTGKTRVLTTRIAYLLQEGKAIPPNILAVTFTNKAAKEMRERVETFSGNQSYGLWLGTFHSIALRILRQHADLLNLPKQFSVIDPDDVLRALKAICKDMHIDDKQLSPKTVMYYIERLKDKAKKPEDAELSDVGGQEDVLKIYARYQARLQQVGAVDFGDLLLHNVTLFTKYPHILQQYHQRFRYILVDEYQDTNIAQYLWLRLLAQGHRNICCVGDDDQSIYGWRGAEVQNILRFERDFTTQAGEAPPIIRLEENYRSTGHILAAATDIIAHNTDRLGKNLFTSGEMGEKIRLIKCPDDRVEAQWITQQISDQAGGKQYDQHAILVRASHQTRQCEEQLMAHSIPYQVIGGLRFYERMEIRDIIAYLRITLNPENDLALERIINTPKRGIGEGSLAKFRAHAAMHALSLLDALRDLNGTGKLSKKQAMFIGDFLAARDFWEDQISIQTPAELARCVAMQSGYIEMWEAQKTEESRGRLDNIKEMFEAMEEFDTLEQFLEHVSLVSDGDAQKDEKLVSIMTIHAAKGLEFEHVYLPGWEEGIFPSQRSIDEKGASALEEERRLAYVAITRARQHLAITHCMSRRLFGQWQAGLPSRFVDELPQEHLAEIDLTHASAYGHVPLTGFDESRYAGHTRTPRMAVQTGAFAVGEKIFHQKFGYGKVADIQGDNVTVHFRLTSPRTIKADYLQKADTV